jgi:hypothetical protein
MSRIGSWLWLPLMLAVTLNHSHQHVNALTLHTSRYAQQSHRVGRSQVKLYMTSTTTSWDKLTVPELKSQLKERSLPVSGVKAELIKRLQEHEASASPTSSPDDNQPSKKKTTSFPPPKDETEVQVIEKEVQETVRMLEGLKLGSSSQYVKIELQSTSGESPQQKQQKKMMKSLQDSLLQSQQQSSPSTNTEQSQPASPAQFARAERMKHHVEQLRQRPANELKEELASFKLANKGRKPDLVSRLADYYVSQEMGDDTEGDLEDDDDYSEITSLPKSTFNAPKSLDKDVSISFAGIPRLSTTASNAIYQAFSSHDGKSTKQPEPTPIQSVAIPKLFYPPHPSALLHAPTGSGKTLTYLLPITETLWREVESDEGIDANDMGNGVAIVLLPTRELAAQVAGVATVLAPRGMVRLVPRPMDLMNCWKDEGDRGEDFAYYEENEDVEDDAENPGEKYSPRILVGSAKSISVSLFGDGKMPGTPTSKPEGKRLLSCTRWVVMDEVGMMFLSVNSPPVIFIHVLTLLLISQYRSPAQCKEDTNRQNKQTP